MHYPDLAVCDYFGAGGDRLLAVGWLEPGHQFESGEVPPELSHQLRRRLKNRWAPVVLAGGQCCGFCPEQTSFSVANIFVPGDGVVYVCPEGILHYISVHQYRPPTEFMAAVESAPLPISIEYFEIMREVGLSPKSPADALADHLALLQEIEDYLGEISEADGSGGSAGRGAF